MATATITVSRADFTRELIPDSDPDTSWLEQNGWEERLAEYHDGGFGFVGVRASVDIDIPQGTYSIQQTISTPGLWGIESDSGEEYLNQVFSEESSTLVEMLAALGVEVVD